MCFFFQMYNILMLSFFEYIKLCWMQALYGHNKDVKLRQSEILLQSVLKFENYNNVSKSKLAYKNIETSLFLELSFENSVMFIRKPQI